MSDDKRVWVLVFYLLFAGIVSVISQRRVISVIDSTTPMATYGKDEMYAYGSSKDDEQQYELYDPNIIRVMKDDTIYNTKEWDVSPIVIEEYKLIFFTVPKVACTVWKTLFRRMMGINEESKSLHNPNRNGLKYLNNFNISYATTLMNSPDYTRAIFLRDPKERLLSAYKDKVLQLRTNDFVYKKCCQPKKIENLPLDTSSFISSLSSSSTTSSSSSCSSFSFFKQMTNSSSLITFDQFFTVAKVCNNSHWKSQANRMETKFFSTINFIGYLDTAEQDAKRLLQLIGAWEEYGTTGWGKYKNESIFHSTSAVSHATNAHAHVSTYYSNSKPTLEQEVETFYEADYNHPLFEFNATRRTINQN